MMNQTVLFTKKKILSLSNQRFLLNHKIVKDLQQSFGNFREIIIYNCKKLFSDEINLKFENFFLNLKITNILQQITRVVIEQIFIIFVAMLLIIINYFKFVVGTSVILVSVIKLKKI